MLLKISNSRTLSIRKLGISNTAKTKSIIQGIGTTNGTIISTSQGGINNRILRISGIKTTTPTP